MYGLDLHLTRDSSDTVVSTSYRKVMVRAHPDKPGGRATLAKRITEAHSRWQNGKKNSRSAGRPSESHGPLVTAGARKQKDYRIHSAAVLLTWQGFADVSCWGPFVEWLQSRVGQWGVKHWGATLETNLDGTLHAHAMFQFKKQVDRGTNGFTFQGKRPNASTSDLLGEALWGNKAQQSVNRGFFYVWANKEGTQKTASGELCVAGDYEPCWTRGPSSGEAR